MGGNRFFSKNRFRTERRYTLGKHQALICLGENWIVWKVKHYTAKVQLLKTFRAIETMWNWSVYHIYQRCEIRVSNAADSVYTALKKKRSAKLKTHQRKIKQKCPTIQNFKTCDKVTYPCVPRVCWAVSVAGKNLFRRCAILMCLSCMRVVTFGRPGRGRSLTLPVCWYRVLSLEIVETWQFSLLATSLFAIPTASMPMAWFLKVSLRRGILSFDSFRMMFCFFRLWQYWLSTNIEIRILNMNITSARGNNDFRTWMITLSYASTHEKHLSWGANKTSRKTCSESIKVAN